jgi:hypothetical protein
MIVSIYICRLINDSEYCRGYAYGIDHGAAIDGLSANGLIQLSSTYTLLDSPLYDGLAHYYRELAESKAAICDDSRHRRNICLRGTVEDTLK